MSDISPILLLAPKMTAANYEDIIDEGRLLVNKAPNTATKQQYMGEMELLANLKMMFQEEANANVQD